MIWLSLDEASEYSAVYLERTRNLIGYAYSTWHLRRLAVDASNGIVGECGIALRVQKNPKHRDRWQVEQKSLERYLDVCAQPHKAHKEHTRVVRGKSSVVKSSRGEQ